MSGREGRARRIHRDMHRLVPRRLQLYERQQQQQQHVIDLGEAAD